MTNQKKKGLTASGSISAGKSSWSKHRPEIVQTKSSFVGSKITSLHVSSQTAQREGKNPHSVILVKETNQFCLMKLTMNISSLLTHKYISNMIVCAIFSRASMIQYHRFSKASATLPCGHLISKCLVKNYTVIIHLSIKHISRKQNQEKWTILQIYTFQWLYISVTLAMYMSVQLIIECVCVCLSI